MTDTNILDALECSYQETQRYGSGTYGQSNKTYCNDQCTVLLSPSFIMAMLSKDKNQLAFPTKKIIPLLGLKEPTDIFKAYPPIF